MRDSERLWTIWGGGSAEPSYISLNDLYNLSDIVVVIMLGGDARLAVERNLIAHNIPCVQGYELLLEMSLGNHISPEEFLEGESLVFSLYDRLIDDDSRKIYSGSLVRRLAPQLALYSYKDLFSGRAYFHHHFFPITQHECFVDCGAYVGDSLQDLLSVGDIDSAYCFEVDDENFETLKNYVNSLPKNLSTRVQLIHKGVWKDHEFLTYGNETLSSSEGVSLCKTANATEIEVESIDRVVGGNPVTYIKMDIEGSEQAALVGAKETIMSQKPNLAICLYHKIDDFWKIYQRLSEMVSNYRFGVGHDSKSFEGTCLYAFVSK